MKSVFPILCSIFVLGDVNSMFDQCADSYSTRKKVDVSSISPEEISQKDQKYVAISTNRGRTSNKRFKTPIAQNCEDLFGNQTEVPHTFNPGYPNIFTTFYKNIFTEEDYADAPEDYMDVDEDSESAKSSEQISALPQPDTLMKRSASVNNFNDYSAQIPISSANAKICASASCFYPISGQFNPDCPLILARDNRTLENTIYTQNASAADVSAIMTQKKVARTVAIDRGGIRGIIPANW